MDAGYDLKLDNPRNKANILSKLILGWMIKICRKGTQKGLEVADLYKTLKCDESESLTDALEKHWDNEVIQAKVKNRNPSLLKALVKTFFWKYMFYGVLLFFQLMILSSFQPVVLGYFLNLFSHDDNINLLYACGTVLVVQSILITFCQHHIEFGQSSIGMRIRIAVSSLVYRKILKLNKKSLGQTAAGQVVNLLSNDVNRFDMVMVALHYLWLMPLQVILVTYLIWRQVGISALAGVMSMVLLTLPVQGYLGKITSRLRLQVAERTDNRVKLMSEVIAGIQVIKMYAWEKSFEKVIKLARKSEVKVLTKASYLRGVYMSCMVFIERTTLFLTLVCYVLLGHVITPEQVFSLARFYNLLQLAMAILYPMAISFGAEALVSVKRLQTFLILEEKPESIVKKSNDGNILLSNITASWTPANITLKEFNLQIPKGKLCAVIGPVGAGKSSLLQIILGELSPSCGSISVGGTISYASQEAWLFAANVRNNILFGLEYDKERYRNVVRVCALLKDFEQFPQGDKTIVGERGVSLSGGQRARINLARAIYREADVYLLDDPLSAVDTHVGRHLFEECISKHLKKKTRILVTHQLQYLQKADIIVVVNDGRIEAQGTFEEISSSNIDFSKLLVNQDDHDDKEENIKPSEFKRKASILSGISCTSEVSHPDEQHENEELVDYTNSTPLKDYIKASGNWCAIFSVISILILGQAACSGADYWVTLWTQQEAIRHSSPPDVETRTVNEFVPLHNDLLENKSIYAYNWIDDITEEIIVNGHTYNLVQTNIAIYIYTGLIITAIILTLVRSFAFFKMAMNSSRNLHTKMFHALLKAPMLFFNTNPSGRVLNRFSKDMGAIDELLPRVLMDAIQILLVMTGILVMVAVANYYMIIAMLLLGIFFHKVRYWYVCTAKDVKHLEGITKSPVFSHLNSSLNGITTIRASEAETLLKKQFDHHQDVHTSAWFLTIACRICFGLWLDLISVLFVAVVVFSFILLNHFMDVSSSLVGLAVSQSLILTGMLQFGMRQTAEVVNQLTCVERVMQYTKLDNETEMGETGEELDKNWPKSGAIVFKHLSLRYSPNDDPVLKQLNIDVPSGSKVGIVGRTGAGKSSLIAALFRLTPLEGEILIDGVTTNNITLSELRKKISIIPQEPVLFSASLRYNLDPFNEYDDKSIWNAIEEVELKEAIDSLDFMVSEGGSNFSLGQRQLLCLARAILRNNKILVLDEATASVDPKTDALIQSTIRRKFQECTVLTIAHRLNTIMDSDMVLVMDFGEVKEYDHPHILLQNTNGYFYKMVAETGPNMTQQLKQISHDVYLKSIEEV